MSYCVFVRIACNPPKSKKARDRLRMIMFQHTQEEDYWPILDSGKWYTMKEDLIILSKEFPESVFMIAYTGDSHELQWFEAKNGLLNTGRKIVPSQGLKQALRQINASSDFDEYQNDIIGSVHDQCLQEKILELGLMDLSPYFHKVSELTDEIFDSHSGISNPVDLPS